MNIPNNIESSLNIYLCCVISKHTFRHSDDSTACEVGHLKWNSWTPGGDSTVHVGIVRDSDSLFGFMEMMIGIDNAGEMCQALGGRLAEPRTVEEAREIARLCRYNDPGKTLLLDVV